MDKISPVRTGGKISENFQLKPLDTYVYIMHSQGVYTKCVLHVVIVFSEQLLRHVIKAGVCRLLLE